MSHPRRTSRRRAWTALTLPALLCVLAACTSGSGGSGPDDAAPAKSASPTPSGPPGTLFDDFRYSGPDDPALKANGWEVRTGGGGPGIKDTWTSAGASFPSDATAQGGRALQLQSSTDGTKQGTKQVEIQTTGTPLFTGTYAARVYLSDKPVSGRNGDHVVETFFPISASDSSPNYSELDYEYLPNGGWGSVGPQLDTTSWFKADPPDRVTHALKKQRLEGWHIMMITFMDGKATYSLDGKDLFTSSGKYVPREKVDMHFSNWFIDLPFTGGSRTWNMKVNWFYYKAGEAVSQADVQKTVDGFYSAGTSHINTVPKS
ncbi:glycoside hydrolase family 16 protein [Streptomyces sp. NPDC002812]|uniref:glycoside hydrolase family 16 protein n=1 Tax=unclassified Streptomyces TaxID=2593676 RepID=UPI00225380F3|nr:MULTISPECIES: glycoside hydrolase family 16 protein [unclassified Streptomyces]MCX5126329.1 glycoside hydrolase family 16 protein [Streptomyces sp. NBC_00347]MCX5299959.1 glycoside hydrolase family 16 protein [Streptomyces sp. NBC_00193]